MKIHRNFNLPYWLEAGVPPPSVSAPCRLIVTKPDESPLLINNQFHKKPSLTTPGTFSSNNSLLPPLLVHSSDRKSTSYGSIQNPDFLRVDVNNANDTSSNEDSETEESRVRRRQRRLSLRAEHWCYQYLGMILIIFHTIFSSLSGLTVKFLEDDFHPYSISFWRFVNIFLISSCILLIRKFVMKKKIWPRPLVEEKYENLRNITLVMLRGILGCTGRILYIFSITCMNLADAMVIASSTPVFMTFFAYFLLGEDCGIVPVIVALITLVGVGIITRPPWLTGGPEYDKDVLLGTGTGVAGMIITTLVMIVMRKLRHINHFLITLSFASWGAVISIFLCWHNEVFSVPTQTGDIIMIFASGATSFLGQTFLTVGLKYESAGIVALLTNFSVVFSFIFEYLFLHIAPDIYSITGGIIVIICIVITTFRKWVGNLREDHEIRRAFFFLLV